MTAIDGPGGTPLNAANVLHKISDDQHTGILTNIGNLTVSEGYLTKASAGGIPLAMEDHFVLGGGYLILAFHIKHAQYPAAIGTYYYPTYFYHSIPFNGVTDVIPTFIAVTADGTPQNCTLSASLATAGTSAEKRAAMLSVQVTTRTITGPSYNPYATGYVQVGA